MASAGPTIVAKFMADTSQMTGEVDKATSGAGSKMASFAKTAALAVGGAFVVDKIVDFGKASVEAAAADEEAQQKLAQTLKNTAGATDAQVASTEDYISTLSKQAAIADDDLRPAMEQLSRGFGDTEKAQKALSLATDVSAGTGKDLTSVTTAMMKAAQGSTGALQKLGVETKNADGSAKSLDQIMADMAVTFKGQAATAADSTAGQMRKAQIAMGELQETIGGALLPVIATLATFLTTTLLPAFETVFGWLMDNKDVVVAALVAIGVVLLPMFVSWAIAAGAAAIATIAAAAPLIAIGVAVAAVAYVIIHNWDTIVAATTAAWDLIFGAVKFVWDWITNNWPLLLAILTGPFGAAVLLIVTHWDTIKNAVIGVYNWIKDNWPLLLAVITGPFGLAVLAITRNWDTIKDAVTGAYEWVRDKFDAIVGFVTGMPQRMATAARNMFQAIPDAFKAALNLLIRAWNSLDFGIDISIPDWVPGVGGRGFEIKDIFPDVPYLAAGGITTGPTLAMIGERRQEAIIPLDALPGLLGGGGGPIDARVIVNGPVYGVDDLNAWADERDRRLATVLSSGRRP